MQLRQAQQDVLDHVREAMAAGKRDIFIQAPTGTGKSLIALELSKILQESGYMSYLLTSEKSLQQQYEYDCNVKFAVRHSDVKSISGVDTYTCDVNGEKFSLGVCRSLGMSYGEAEKLPCAGTCAYIQRRRAAMLSPRSLMNYSYWLIQMNYVLRKMGDNSPFRVRDVIICDEAHKIPDIVESHFACRLKPETADRINGVIGALRKIGHMYDVSTLPLHTAITEALAVPEKSSPADHHSALQRVYAEYTFVKNTLDTIKTSLSSSFIPGGYDNANLTSWHKNLPREVKNLFKLADDIKDHHCKVEDYTQMIEQHGLHNLVVCDEDGERAYHNMSDHLLFHRHFRNFARTRIYMSATLQPKLLIDRWKLDPTKCYIINVNSDWDSANSPIVLCNTADMGYSGGRAAIGKAVKKIDELLDTHMHERGVIHTVTHLIADELKTNSRHATRLLTYANTAEKLELLDQLESTPSNSVLVGPSLFTGIDLADDKGRFNIITKLAFPNVGNTLWARRFKFARDVYFGETAAVLEQSAGRTTRHVDDYSTTYILDSRAKDFLKYSRRYMSDTFMERLVKPPVR
jgi:Rad3-related DNA helicase